MLMTLPGAKALSGSEYVLEQDAFRIEIEVESETASGGDVKGMYVHVASESGMAAFEKARELSLRLVDALGLVIYDHEAGSYVGREAFASLLIAGNGELFHEEASSRDRQTALKVAPAGPVAGKGGCLGLVILVAGSLPALVSYLL